jgi:hypothetical protein
MNDVSVFWPIEGRKSTTSWPMMLAADRIGVVPQYATTIILSTACMAEEFLRLLSTIRPTRESHDPARRSVRFDDRPPTRSVGRGSATKRCSGH